MPVAALLAAIVLAVAAGNDIVVTRDSDALPSGCTPREAAELLVRLGEAVNAGDEQALRRVFAIEEGDHGVARPERYFRWYSVNEVTVYDIADLFPYFASRHRQNERWQLIAVEVGGSWIPGAAGITYLIRRQADDVAPAAGELAFGKGELDCAAQRIFVWSMAHHESVPQRPACPLPEAWAPGEPIVACARTGVTGTGVNAAAVLPDFRIVSPSARLPRACAPRNVAAGVRSALTGLNAGKAARFARQFARRGHLSAYGGGWTGHAAIARFAAGRYAAGGGWTAAVLTSPRRIAVGPRRAVYRLDLLLTRRGEPLTGASAKVVADCRSGLFVAWAGPAA